MIRIPTLQELYTQVLSDLESEFGVNTPVFGKNFIRVLATVQAAKLKIQYLAIANLQKNIFVDTAEPESIGGTLERFGRVKLGRNPFPAQAGKYDVDVTGSIGAIIKASTTFKSNDDSSSPGKLFVLDTDFTLTATTDTITLRALEAGLDSQLEVGDELTVTAPIAGVDDIATVTAENTEPKAAEDIEDYRTKALNSYRTEPQGGAGSDYRLWAQDAQGVEQVYPYAKSGSPWETNLYVEATIADSTDGKGTPSASLLSDVEDVIDFDPDTTKPLDERGRRPINVVVNYLPVTIKSIDIDIASYSGITTAIQAQILTALTTEINKIRPFVASVDILDNKNDILDVNKIIATILNAKPGSVFGTITLQVDSIGTSSFQFINGQIPYLNSVTYS